MALKNRIKKKFSSGYESAKNFVGRYTDKASDYGDELREGAKAGGQKLRENYKQYKDPAILGTAALLGAVLTPLTFGATAPLTIAALAALGGASAYSGTSSILAGRDAKKQAKDAIASWDSQMSGLEGNSLADLLRRRRIRRGAGEGVAEFESESKGLADAQDVKVA